MKKLHLLSFVCAFIAVISFNVSAATVSMDGLNRVSLISGLTIDNYGIYDVTVHYEESYLTVFSSSTPLFLNDETGANAAANAIFDELNSQVITPAASIHIFIPYDASSSIISRDVYHTGSGVWAQRQDGAPPASTYTTAGFATFETSAVPIPPAVWLFSSGLLGLLGLSRRKKAA